MQGAGCGARAESSRQGTAKVPWRCISWSRYTAGFLRNDQPLLRPRCMLQAVLFWQLEGASVDAVALPQILDKSRRSEYIFDRVEWVSHSEAERCFRHQLHEPQCSGSRSCSRITSGLDLGYRSQEVGVQPVHIADGDAERSFVILSRPCDSVSTECGSYLDECDERRKQRCAAALHRKSRRAGCQAAQHIQFTAPRLSPGSWCRQSADAQSG